MENSFYNKHVFVCENKKDDGSQHCGNFNPRVTRDYVKATLKEVGKHGKGEIRVSGAACLGRCEEGPVMVVYPEAVWYCYVDQEDVEEIIDEHLLNNRPVTRLMLPNT